MAVDKLKVAKEFKSSENDKIILFDFGATRKFPKRYIDPFSKLISSSLFIASTKSILEISS